jgi:hypothetical protein
METEIIEHGRRFSEGEDLSQLQHKVLCGSLSSTCRIFMRKVISSMNADLLQLELTSLMNAVFSSHDSSVVLSEKAAADKRAHVFHIFRIISEISEHSSSSSAKSSPTALKAKELICRSMITAVLQCAKVRSTSEPHTLESQLDALSLACEWLSLTTSGQVQNGAVAVPVSHESPHPYPATALDITHDVSIPGAISLKVQFNKKSDTYSEAHIVSFNSSSMSKPEVYSKRAWAGVGSCPTLSIDGDAFTATFHSNGGGGSNWGYSFTVTPVFPDLSSLLLLPLRVAITSLCFGSIDLLLKCDAAPAVVCSSESAPCLVVSLLDEIHRQSDIGQRFQHLIRGPNSLIHVFKGSQESLSSLFAHAHAASMVNHSLPHVNDQLLNLQLCIA